MARVKPDTDRAAEIRRVMDDTGYDEVLAAFAVALERGETDGDVQSVGPMTPEERRRIGLDVIADDGGDPVLELTPDREAEIVRVMRELGVDEIEAAFIAGIERGDIDGDILFTSPVTPEQRRRMGLDVVAGEEGDPDLNENGIADDLDG